MYFNRCQVKVWFEAARNIAFHKDNLNEFRKMHYFSIENHGYTKYHFIFIPYGFGRWLLNWWFSLTFSHAGAIRNAGLESSENLFRHVWLLRREEEIWVVGGRAAAARDLWTSRCICVSAIHSLFSVQLAG